MSQYRLRKIRDSGCSWNGLGNQTPILTIKDITGKTWSQVSKQGQRISIKYISIQAVQPYASWRPFSSHLSLFYSQLPQKAVFTFITISLSISHIHSQSLSLSFFRAWGWDGWRDIVRKHWEKEKGRVSFTERWWATETDKARGGIEKGV